MSRRTSRIRIVALLVAACSAPAPEPRAAGPAPPSAESAGTRSAPTVRRYGCAGGATVLATYYPPDSVAVQYHDRVHLMRIAISASGARFAGDSLEWWTKGSGPGAAGTLFRHQADGTTGTAIEACVER